MPFKVTHHKPFRKRKRRANTLVNLAVIHQSVTSSVGSTERELRKKKYGVHIMVEGDGSIHQYNDLADKLPHANEVNGRCIGVEVVNPYTVTKKYWTEMIDPSPTAWRKKEAADTPAQLESLDALLSILCSHCYDLDNGCTMELPLEMPTQEPDGPCRGTGEVWFDKAAGGIVAHGHRPSRYPEGHPKEGQRVPGGHADGRMTLWKLYNRRLGIL